MKEPTFLHYTQEDHERARRDPYLRAFIEWVEFERDRAVEAVLFAVRARNFDEAFYLLSKADALGDAASRFTAQNEPEESAAVEDEYDPALPPSARRPHARPE